MRGIDLLHSEEIFLDTQLTDSEGKRHDVRLEAVGVTWDESYDAYDERGVLRTYPERGYFVHSIRVYEGACPAILKTGKDITAQVYEWLDKAEIAELEEILQTHYFELVHEM